jgi:hypothetical protein
MRLASQAKNENKMQLPIESSGSIVLGKLPSPGFADLRRRGSSNNLTLTSHSSAAAS